MRNLAVQYESDIVHVEHVAKLSLQMFDSLVERRPVHAPPTVSASSCGRPRCSTTSA